MSYVRPIHRELIKYSFLKSYGSLKCASLVLYIRICPSLLLLKFRECDSITSKENIQAGYRDGLRIVNC